MTENEAISKMKAPSNKRPTWGNGIIQICITRACDLSCIGCTQGSNLAGKPMMMSLVQFAEAAISLRNYHGVVGVFGGNPCMHPQFDYICAILRASRPKKLCGLWSNNLRGYGKICRETFNPEWSNLNVHMNHDAYMEILHDWPEARPKGINDSRHSPPYVALKDIEDMNDEQRWDLISNCDINQYWSAMIGVFRSELRGWFCELAGAQSMLHEHEPDYPDTGVQITDHWWKGKIHDYRNQIEKHCMECGIPLRGMGDHAVTGKKEQVSISHLNIYNLKRPAGKMVELVTKRDQLNGEVKVATNYIENGIIYK